MDILIHTLSGTAAATAIAGVTHKKGWRKGAIIFLGAIAGALPDLDVISLWSGFDSTIGAWFDLPSGRAIYTGKYWYSHHAFLHSLVGDALVTTLFALLFFVVERFRQKGLKFRQFLRDKAVYLLTFFLAFIAHLLGDLPTPGAAWDGIALWWPASTYAGGFGATWWWNNYDIFLILLAGIVLNVLLISLNGLLRKHFMRWLPTGIVGAALALICFQLATRPHDFDYEGWCGDEQFRSYEAESKRIQREILGDALYEQMEAFDNSIPLNF